jgi:hypothetical protein
VKPVLQLILQEVPEGRVPELQLPTPLPKLPLVGGVKLQIDTEQVCKINVPAEQIVAGILGA